MTKKTILIIFSILALSIIFAGVFFSFSNSQNPDPKTHRLKFDTLEIADNGDEHRQGLMNRNELCEKCGMLFVFNSQQPRSFWMKNTFIPLDIIYINSNSEVVKIYENTKTNQIDERYPSIEPIRYVLEVNSGYANKNSINKNDKIDINQLIENGVDYQYEINL